MLVWGCQKAPVGVGSLAERANAGLDSAGAVRMRYVLLGVLIAVVLLPATAGQVRADGGLTSAVAGVYFARYEDATLHDIAHQRVAEAKACRCLDHDLMRPGTAEVLAWNTNLPNPVGSAVAGWIGSPVHHGILSDASKGRIGCAELVDGATHWFACVLAAGPLPVAPVVVALPNTAMGLLPGAVPARGRLLPI